MFWKVYFWLGIVFSAISIPFYREVLRFWEVLDIFLCLVAMGGLYGFAWEKRIFTERFWKAFFVIWVVWSPMYHYAVPLPEKMLSVGQFLIAQWLMASITLIPVLPLFYAVWRYSFPKNETVMVSMKKRMIMMVVAVLGTASMLHAATIENTSLPQTGVPSEIDTPAVETAVVKLDGTPLFRVRGMAGFSAAERAKAIQKRLKSIAADPSVSTTTIALNDLTGRTELLAGNIVLATLLDADAATEQLPRMVVAERGRLNLIHAILDYRHDRSATVLFRRTLVAVAATFGLVIALLVFARFHKRLVSAAELYVKARFLNLEARSANVIESRPLWAMVVGLLNLTRIAFIFGIFYFYLNLVLGLYPWTRPLAADLFSLFITPLRTLGSNFLSAVPNLAFLIILFFIVKYLLKITRLFFNGISQGTFVFKDFEQDWAIPTFRIVRILIICFAVVIAYPYIPGSNSGAFKGVSLFVGVIFSLGSTSFIANMIAGIALTYRRAFKVGDLIKVENVMGLVTDMRIQTTHLRTLHNEVIIIPNSVPLNSHVINYSLLAKSNGLVLHTTVGIGYETPWRQVEAMLMMAADRTPGLKQGSKPFVRQLALEDFCVKYELGVYCETPLSMPWVYTDLHRNILDVFNEYGVQIMTPAYEGDPEQPKIVPKDQFFTAPGEKIKSPSGDSKPT